MRRPNVPAFIAENLNNANDDLIRQLLADFDWRSRVAGTLLLALQERKDLWFDQNSVMAALAYLDQQNKTGEMTQYLDRWSAFVADKQSWDFEHSIESFAEDMATLRGLQRSRDV